MIQVKEGSNGSARCPESSCSSLQEGCSSRAVHVNGRKVIKRKNMLQYVQLFLIHEKVGDSRRLDSTSRQYPIHMFGDLRFTMGPRPILDDEPVRANTFLTEKISASERRSRLVRIYPAKSSTRRWRLRSLFVFLNELAID
jgi:hypothetical protein